jgi:hypothetical protein
VPVQTTPLAVCDFRSVSPGDLVPMDIVYPHFLDEAYEVRYNPGHRWFYKPNMRWDDAIVFKLHDTADEEATGMQCSTVWSEPREDMHMCTLTRGLQSVRMGPLSTPASRRGRHHRGRASRSRPSSSARLVGWSVLEVSLPGLGMMKYQQLPDDHGMNKSGACTK